jgi:YidC/Oxa1 family membrane protein insertase
VTLTAVALLALLAAGCSVDPQTNPVDNEGFWDRYFVNPLSVTLDWFADLAWGAYGISILIVTVIIRTLILPLAIKQYRSSKAMQALQPELNKLREKYKDNQQKLQEETMKLFQKHGVNPLAGCMPVLIQMPILIALYQAIMRNPEIYNHGFLWLQLGERDPYYILPVIAAFTTFLQQKLMMSYQPPAPQMQILLVIFPILIFVMSMSFPAALPLYWVYSNIYTIVQSYFLYGRKSKDDKNKTPAKAKKV